DHQRGAVRGVLRIVAAGDDEAGRLARAAGGRVPGAEGIRAEILPALRGARVLLHVDLALPGDDAGHREGDVGLLGRDRESDDRQVVVTDRQGEARHGGSVDPGEAARRVGPVELLPHGARRGPTPQVHLAAARLARAPGGEERASGRDHELRLLAEDRRIVDAGGGTDHLPGAAGPALGQDPAVLAERGVRVDDDWPAVGACRDPYAVTQSTRWRQLTDGTSGSRASQLLPER